MTASSLRVGVLGCGRIGQMHADLVARHVEGLTLAACYDFVPELAAGVAERHGGRSVADAHELIESPDVDVVAICSPTEFHIDQLVTAAKAGKPVLVEKPLSLDLAQVDLGIDAVNASGIPVQVGFNRRFDASHRSVRDHVAAGAVGDIHVVRITSRDPAPPPLSYIETSGGIFLDMTIHDFDMARFVTQSEVTEVYARGSVRVDPAIGAANDLDTVVVVMQHENGALTTIDNSRQAVYGYDQRVEVFGSAGMVSSDNSGVTSTSLRTADGSHGPTIPYFFIERYLPSYIAEWNAFVAMVRDGAPSPVTLDDGRAPLLLGLAAWQSVRERRPVAVSEIT